MAQNPLPTKQVRYGDRTVSLVRDGTNVYSYRDGVQLLNRNFETPAQATKFFADLKEIPAPTKQSVVQVSGSFGQVFSTA